MKIRFVLSACLTLGAAIIVAGQWSRSIVEVITTYSQNGHFYLKSIPYDSEFPTLRGKTFVYESGSTTPMYVFERGFDSVNRDSNNLILSDNGEVIFYAIPAAPNEEKEGLESVTIYRNGKIFKSFTKSEITGCVESKERCSLVYSNFEEVVDKEKSNWWTKNYSKVFKAGVDERERFLSDFPIFSFADTVYLTDSKKKVHRFDLKSGNYVASEPFEKVFEQIKQKGRFTRTELKPYNMEIMLDFPKLKNGRDVHRSLAEFLGMKPASVSTRKDEKYKLYAFKMNGTLSRDGSLEIEDLEFFSDQLPRDKIIEFFKANKLDSSLLPDIFDKWNLDDEYFFFRKANDRIARREKRQEIIEGRAALKKRMTMETIDGVYIPKNMGECFIELDKLLPEIDKKEMLALAQRSDMILYHHGLGTWIRNNWGLWAGSRLQKYFTDKGLRHPDDISGVILDYYHDWLNGKKDTWKNWEQNPKR